MKFTNAKEVISHLYSLPNLHAKNDLSYIKRVLAVLDNPQDKVKSIHITGTNGKGSTSYYLSNLLKKAGQKTGLFVSPYIYEFNERIQVNGENIPNDDLVLLANEVEKAIATIKKQDSKFALVTFEYEVVMAFIYFAWQKCDYAVIEVGIGGQHDKTNVITPEVSIITTVGLDHEKIIGPTIQDIAREKAGIIKKGRPVVVGNVPKEVLPIIEKKAYDEKAPLYLLWRDFTVTDDEHITYACGNYQLSFKTRPRVESYDIAVAICAFHLLDLPLSSDKIRSAIDNTLIPGRYHLLKSNPLIILDGAHNIQAMKNLLEFMHAQREKRKGTIRVLITMMKDKDLEEVFSLFDNEDQVVLTTIPYPRAAKLSDFPSDIQKRYPYEENWQKAFDKMKKESQKDDILLVTGSFYLVGAALNMEEK
ncbi:folylpolyglutamate synthase/dihydrofolate synthase family protein [Lactobacillus sp. LL6]|uniref:bifunctional folylpolyglutamate synthase/dihydrofolate synthase n=1 Tax=Lactobacillus sp. LL6 TaxID=2596827 RepID=UPI00118497BD|nr:folylpolyglutamate synthase/dihydrofolate synthase family protein [Lactobacillus sp. LL6]TSO26153.1 bifunctional folylpolyglutamate synthase/dihydrofolate synthase [Lactobacillus sp. LL6]